MGEYGSGYLMGEAGKFKVQKGRNNTQRIRTPERRGMRCGG
jgi:hypothetical protein